MTQQVELSLDKETGNKLRWNRRIKNANFEQYIPKWRVPIPWPTTIQVTIESSDEKILSSPTHARAEIEGNNELIQRPIVANVIWLEDKTETAHYSPEGDKDECEIGEPYIPFEISKGEMRLHLTVRWAIDTLGFVA